MKQLDTSLKPSITALKRRHGGLLGKTEILNVVVTNDYDDAADTI